MSYKQIGESFEQQVADQKLQVESLKTALHKLEQKLAEAQSKSDLLIAQHRRSRAITKASEAQLNVGDRSKGATFDRMKDKVARSEAVSRATSQLVVDDVDDRFAALEKEDQINKLLAELKSRRGVTA